MLIQRSYWKDLPQELLENLPILPGMPSEREAKTPAYCQFQTDQTGKVTRVLYTAPFPLYLYGEPLFDVMQDVVEAHLDKHLTRCLPPEARICLVFQDGMSKAALLVS